MGNQNNYRYRRNALLLCLVPVLANSAFSATDSLIPSLSRFLDKEGLPVNRAVAERTINPVIATPVQPQVAVAPGNLDNLVVDGLIVRFVDSQATANADNNRAPPAELVQLLIDQAGSSLYFDRPMSMGAFVFRFDTPLEWREAGPIIKRVSQSPQIETVEADVRFNVNLYPNDPYLFNQWSLAPPEFFAGGINAIDAWDISTGGNTTVVAVIDTGIAVAHAFGFGRVLPGYDFVSDPFVANDGGGRDPNPADPGDWIEPGDCAAPHPARNSTWHGTHVAGTLAAPGNDRIGIAGIDWKTRILPIRVLGKCGGSMSDVIDGMRWAAGLNVPGVPANPHPARVLNLSLGAPSPFGCSSRLLRQVINEIKQQNALIVVAAGNNDTEAATFVPASCDGVMTVGATDHLGLRSSFSNYSFANRVHISAPGGDISYYGDIEAGILSMVDAGQKRPTGSVNYAYSEGTSMAAPHVSGVAGLALALDPDQHTQMIGAIMRITSRDFPFGSECDIHYPLCGDGLLDADNTLQAVSILKPYHLVWGFYNPDINHYFRAGGYDEVELVLTGTFGHWLDTEDHFIAWRDGSQGAVPVCRFYGTPGVGPNSHFYTGDPAECAKVKKDQGWTYEGTAFYIKLPVNGRCTADTIPVYRYYNNRWVHNDSNHRYVVDLYDQDQMVSEGWVMEGIAMCAAG